MIWRRVLIFVGLWLVFEFTVSWLATCEKQYARYPDYRYEKDDCTLFSGPFVSISRFAINQIARFLHTYEHELVAGFTIVLGISTILLWWATNLQRQSSERIAREQRLSSENAAREERRLTLASMQVARKSANAAARNAKIAKDALFVGQRPYIFITAAAFDHAFDPDKFDFEGPEVWPFISYRFENHGQTPAVIREICADSICAEKLPDEASYRPETIDGEVNLVLGKNKSEVSPHLFKTPIDGVLLNDIMVGTAIPSVNGRNLYAFGYVKYEDIFDEVITVGFCWQYNPDLKKFLHQENKTYNYRKIELPPPEEV